MRNVLSMIGTEFDEYSVRVNVPGKLYYSAKS
jgi:hypothetical protein